MYFAIRSKCPSKTRKGRKKYKIKNNKKNREKKKYHSVS